MNSRQILATIARSTASRGLYVLLVGSQQHVVRIVAQGSDLLPTTGVARLGNVFAGVISAGPSSHGRERVGKIITSWAYEQFVSNICHLETIVTSKYIIVFLFTTQPIFSRVYRPHVA